MDVTIGRELHTPILPLPSINSTRFPSRQGLIPDLDSGPESLHPGVESPRKRSCTIGLARFDGRADDATLASVGAPNSTRRGFAFWQALVICSLGSVLGGALGILPALAMGLPGGPLPFSPPWMQIILAALVLPVVIAAGSWLLAGRTPKIARRLAVS